MNELKWLIIVLIILLFLFILIIFSKITIYLNYYHHKDDDNLKIEVKLWFGLIRIKKTIPMIKVDNNSPSIIVKGKQKSGEEDKGEEVAQITSHKLITHLKNLREILEHVFQLNIIIKKFLKKVSVEKFEWQSTIGLGDAVYTGVAAGTLWSIKGGIIGVISHYLRMKEMPKLAVQPNFQQMITSTNLLCMFQFRIGYAMLAGIKLVKWWKGGLPHLKPNKIMTS